MRSAARRAFPVPVNDMFGVRRVVGGDNEYDMADRKKPF